MPGYGEALAPSPGAPRASLLQAALVLDHATTAQLQTEIDAASGAGSDNAADAAEEMRWANGISWSPESCADAVAFDPCAALGTTTGMSDSDNPRPAVRNYTPFSLDVHDRCSTYGWQRNDYEARARRMMAARESKGVAKEFWVGAASPTNSHLASTGPNAGPDTVTTVGTALSPRNGLAAIAQALGDANGGAGMIHMRLRLLQYLFSINALRYESGKFYTATGAQVVGDAGYPGTGPNGQAVANASGAITEWIFGTDLVEIHRGPVDVFAKTLSYQSVKLTTNDEIVRAQRLYAPLWNGCALLAASITTPAADF